MIDGSGSIAATYDYDAFGNILESTRTVDNPFRYAGYQYDEETGNYYLNARYYDPITARSLLEDTYRGTANDPLSLNLYTYCHNELIMYCDPTGHSDIPEWDRDGRVDTKDNIDNFDKYNNRIDDWLEDDIEDDWRRDDDDNSWREKTNGEKLVEAIEELITKGDLTEGTKDTNDFSELDELIGCVGYPSYNANNLIKEKAIEEIEGFGQYVYDKSEKAVYYITKTGEKIFLQKYSDEEETAASIGGGVLLSFTGFDFPLDIVNLAYDIQNYDIQN